MYLSSKISVDPSKETIVERVKPTKAFAKVLGFLTAGLSNEKEEQETFTAVSILQQINTAMRLLHINNIVRLSKDDIDFYLDTEGKKDDLKQALDEFSIEVEGIESEMFSTLSLVVEYEDELLKYLVEVNINRIHAVGGYPLVIKVNGFIKSLMNKDEKSAEESLEKEVFTSQEKYEEFTHKLRTQFDSFTDTMSMEIQKTIKCDDVKTDTALKVIRPKDRVKDGKDIPFQRSNTAVEPAYYGYYGYDTMLFTSLLWTDMLYSHNIYCHDMSVVDMQGSNVMNVGNEGFNANETNALNVDEDFEAPTSGDIDYEAGSDFDADLESAGVSMGDESSSDSSFFDFGGDSSDGGDGGSSCSSCGGCGGD